MNLLERIAESNGNPERTIAALRLLNKRLQHQLLTNTGDKSSEELIRLSVQQFNEKQRIEMSILGVHPPNPRTLRDDDPLMLDNFLGHLLAEEKTDQRLGLDQRLELIIASNPGGAEAPIIL